VRRALLCALLLALPAGAQEEPPSPATGGARRAQHPTDDEPTPFWLAPPPPKNSTEKKKPPAPAKKKPAPPADEEPAPPPKKKAKPRVEEPKPVPWQKPVEPPPQRKVVAPPPSTPAAPVEIVPDLPARKPRAPVIEQPAPAPAPPPKFVAPLPEKHPPAPAPLVTPEPEPEPEPIARSDVKHISIDLYAGFWNRSASDGGGGIWDFAYGIRGGYAFFDDKIEADILALRTSATEGSPFLSTTLSHDLIELRGFYVIGDRLAFLAGLGAGIAIAQTHYSIVDPVAGSASTLDASAYKTVVSVTAAGRARIWGGLEARAEVNVLLRDGRLELMPLAGLGFAFW
jgi:hypothetical protein